MCSHDDFEIIYYVMGIMFRRCKVCKRIEMCSDWDWNDPQLVRDALDSLKRYE